MKLALPKSEYPMTRVQSITPDVTWTTTVDATISEIDVVDDKDVLNIAEFLDSRGEPVAIDKMCYVDGSWEAYDPKAHKLPEAKKPEPKPVPKAMPKAEPKAAPKAEPKAADAE